MRQPAPMLEPVILVENGDGTLSWPWTLPDGTRVWSVMRRPTDAPEAYLAGPFGVNW